MTDQSSLTLDDLRRVMSSLPKVNPVYTSYYIERGTGFRCTYLDANGEPQTYLVVHPDDAAAHGWPTLPETGPA